MARPALPLALSALLLLLPHVAAIDTDPGLSASFALFPTAEDVQAALLSHADHPWVELRDLGTSKEGRPVRYAVVTDPDSAVPLTERVVTFLFTQQHGNEPAGTPAALRLLSDITAGADIARTLDNQVLLLLPMANPDGATGNMRVNAEGTDINRDHIGLTSPEANLLHTVLNDWDVHVAMDHHEYGGTGLGNPSPVRVYDYDLTTLFPVHGNVRSPTYDAANRLMYEGIWPAAEADGFTANEYGEQTVAGVPVEYVAGGPDPGIMRNHLGLHNIAGLLVETRVDAHPNPFHDAARREDIHTSVMEATLTYVSDNARLFIDAKRASEAQNLGEPMSQYIEGETVGDLAAAYLTAPEWGGLFDAHGMHPGHLTEAGLVHNMTRSDQGHAAALVHPASSRHVTEGTATEPFSPAAEPVAARAETASGAPLVVLVVALAVLALSRGRA